MRTAGRRSLPFFAFAVLAVTVRSGAALGAAALTVTPLTWNVIGLDSNNVNVGPNNFPVGARVCNVGVTGDATISNVKSSFAFASGDVYTGDTYINLRSGSLSAYTASGVNLAPGACYDFYYEVTVTRDANAYNKTRNYTISATADGGFSATSPSPRQLFVEHLISQNRNSVTTVRYGAVSDYPTVTPGVTLPSVTNGGTLNLVVGQEYWIELDGGTATQGYEQIESFINFPNTIFQTESVSTTYTAEDSATLNPPYTSPYGNACVWENNPSSLNYRSCLDVGKAGGTITVLYKVKILSVPASNPGPLTTLIYDFSGSSYHYNSDYSLSTRYYFVSYPASVTKSFSPSVITNGGTSTLTFTIKNLTASTISNVSLADASGTPGFPSGVTVVSAGSTSGCGAANLSTTSTSISLSNATILGNATCTYSAVVTSTTNGFYTNTTQDLFVDSIDTGLTATDTLTVISSTSLNPCTGGTHTLATWNFNNGGTGTSPTVDTLVDPLVLSTPTALFSGTGTASIDSGTGSPASPSWKSPTTGWPGFQSTTPSPTALPGYFQFTVNTTQFTGGTVTMSLRADLEPNGSWGSNNNNQIFVWQSIDNGSTWVNIEANSTLDKGKWLTAVPATTPTTPGSGNTLYRVFFAGTTGANASSATVAIDAVTFTATCATPLKPTVTKSFSPATVPTSGTTSYASTMTIVITNPNSATNLTGVAITDIMPPGVTITSVTSPQCGGTITPSGTGLSATSLTLSGGSITAAAGSCTINATVKATTVGDHVNTTDYVTSTESGPNTGPNGSASATLTAIDPPIITKSFNPVEITTNGTSTVTFAITNPNTSSPITNLKFTDSLPTNMKVAATPNASTSNCPAVVTWNPLANATSLTFAATGSLAAGATCTVKVDVTATVGGAVPGTTYVNTTSVVTHDVGTFTNVPGNTATANLAVHDPVISAKFNKEIGPTSSGPWSKSISVNAGELVYYRFTVDNTGDVALNITGVSDPNLGGTVAGCTTNPLAVAGTFVCTGGPVSATAPGVTNTATLSYKDSTNPSGAPFTLTSSASYTVVQMNFGHLPVGQCSTQPNCYVGYNLISISPTGARHQTDNSNYLGASVIVESDGGSTPGTNDTSYVFEPNDDGVFPTPNVSWTSGGTGSVDVTVHCAATSCYLNAWIDWNNNGDLFGTGEQIFAANSQVFSTGTTTRTITFNIPSGLTLTGKSYYSRFRLDSVLPAVPRPYGLGSPGEVEDPIFVFDSGPTPTPVTLAYFRADKVGHRVRFRWSTSTEAGNVGFDIYGQAPKGVRTRLTQRPVLTSTPSATKPRDYTLEIASDLPLGSVFYVEDIDVFGNRRSHGPFPLGRSVGKKPSPRPLDWKAIGAERARHQQEQDAAALSVMAAAGTTATKANLLVSADGLYRMTYESLLAAGFNFNGTAARDLALVSNGTAVPIEVTGSSRFGAGSAIQFYGQAHRTLYTDANVYTLLVDRSRALRIASDATAPGLGTPVSSYLETVTVDNDTSYYELSPTGDPWYDTYLFTYNSPVSQDFPITIDKLAGAGTATVSAVFYGGTDFPTSPDHHVVVSVNGNAVADQLFDGLTSPPTQASIPAGVLQEGANTVTLALPGDTGADYDTVVVDKYAITYPRQFFARSGRLAFRSSGGVFSVDGLASANAIVYRVSGGQPTRLTGAQTTPSANGYSVRFPGSATAATYLVTTTESALVPATAVPRSPSGLTTGPAQLLVISHPDFLGGLAPLVSARQAEGLSVKVVDVNDVYTQYSGGVFDPSAIAAYVKYAAANMSTKYVLLVGGDTYDYKNRLGLGAISFVPTLYGQTDDVTYFAPADSLFGDLDGDGVPEIAVGRLPVRTTAQLDALVSKLVAYKSKNYPQTGLFAADANDGATSYKQASLAFIGGLAPGWNVTQANAGDAGVAAARDTLISGMNAGTALVSFIGHSDLSIWTFDGLFSSDDAAALTNAGRPFVATQFGCYNTYYVSPYYETLGHALLLSGDRGAASLMGGVTLTEFDSDAVFGTDLMPLLSTPGVRVGDAIIQAKKTAATANMDMRSVLLGYELLGDPTLVIQP